MTSNSVWKRPGRRVWASDATRTTWVGSRGLSQDCPLVANGAWEVQGLHHVALHWNHVISHLLLVLHLEPGTPIPRVHGFCMALVISHLKSWTLPTSTDARPAGTPSKRHRRRRLHTEITRGGHPAGLLGGELAHLHLSQLGWWPSTWDRM